MTMKAKKHLGITTAVLCVCALLVFNFFIFPNVLAAAPENRGVETITPEAAPPTVEQTGVQEELAEQESIPNINAISKEQAIEIAQGDGFMPSVTYEYSGAIYHATTTVVGAKYMESNDPASDPSWFVLFSQISHGEYSMSVPEGYTAEEYLAHICTMDNVYFGSENMVQVTDWDMVESCADSDGKPVLIYHDITPNNYLVEINALTGAYISGGGLLGEAGGTLDIAVLEKFISDDFNSDDYQPNPTLGPIDASGTAKG